jgi:hypothetical protein
MAMACSMTMKTLALAGLAAGGLIASAGVAAPLVIANSSFESPAFSDGGFDFLVSPAQQGTWGWTIDDGGFIYNPQASDYTGAGGSGAPLGADGAQVGGIYQFGDYVIVQRLAGADAIPGNNDDPVVEPGTVYTLTVSVGQRAAGNPGGGTFGGYDLQLLAGVDRNGVLLGRETNLATPPAGEFITRTVTIVCPTFTNPAATGKPLTVLLLKPTQSASATVDYDNVRLDAVKISPIANANFNEAGAVDGADLALWRIHFAANCLDATHDHGNANSDDVVDGVDFLQWQRELGASAAAVVPEPAAGVFAVMALICCGALRRENGGSRHASDAPLSSTRKVRTYDWTGKARGFTVRVSAAVQ